MPGSFGWAPYANQAVAQIIANHRQRDQDARIAAIQQAQARLLGAQADALDNKSDITGTITAQDGTLYDRHKDGSLSPAVIRGGNANTGPTLPPVRDPIPSAGQPQAGAFPSLPSTPADTNPPPPKFGTRAPQPSTIPGTPEWLAAQRAAAKVRQDMVNPATIPGTPEWKAAKVAEAQISNQYGYHPPQQPSFTPLQGTDPTTGQPITRPFNTKTGAVGAPLDINPKAANGQGGQNAPQMAAARANMEAARKTMDDYEQKLKAGQAKIGVFGATEGALASSPSALTAKGPLDAIMSMGANAASANLQRSDPELARYLTAKKYIAEAILNTHKRPNQTQYEIEQELSGAGPNASPMQIDMGKERRDRMFDEVFSNPAAGAVGAPPTPTRASGKPLSDVDRQHAASDPKFAAWLRSKGYEVP